MKTIVLIVALLAAAMTTAPAHADVSRGAAVGIGVGAFVLGAATHPHYYAPPSLRPTYPRTVNAFCRVHRPDGVVVHVEQGVICRNGSTDIVAYDLQSHSASSQTSPSGCTAATADVRRPQGAGWNPGINPHNGKCTWVHDGQVNVRW